MDINISEFGDRKFLNLGDYVSIPIDRIKKFDFNVANGGASGNSVQIETDDPEEEIIFAFDNCESVKNFLKSHRVL